MIININGKDKELSVLHGKSAIITYEMLAKLARKPSDKVLTLTYRFGKEHGELIAGQIVTVPISSKLIVNILKT